MTELARGWPKRTVFDGIKTELCVASPMPYVLTVFEPVRDGIRFDRGVGFAFGLLVLLR